MRQRVPRGMSRVAIRAASAARAARVLLGGRIGTPGGVVLAYHDVQPADEARTDYVVTPGQLRRQLRDAQRWGVRFVTLAELSGRALRSEPVDGLAAVVFDDALVGVHRHAAPVLADLGVPAALFPVTEGVGRPPAWWPGAHRTMTAAELAELVGLGWEIGGHTRTHRSLPALRDAELGDEVAGSRRELEDALGARVEALAYPFGHHDARVRDACREAGYEVAYTFMNGRIEAGLDPLRLPRLTMVGWAHLRWAYQLSRPGASFIDHQRDEVLD